MSGDLNRHSLELGHGPSVPSVRGADLDDAPRRPRARTTRVVIVEDERLLAEMLTAVIAGEQDMVVVGVAGPLSPRSPWRRGVRTSS